MALTVLRSHTGRPRVFPDYAEGIEVLLFDPIEERGDLSVGERLRAIEPALLLSDVVIFRSSSKKLRLQLERDQIVAELLKDTPTYCLERSYDSENLDPQLVPVADTESGHHIDLEEIRAAEIESILRDTGSLLMAEGRHYLLPSGYHSAGFFRLGNATRSIPATRRLADWLISSLDSDTAMLADTGTILPLLLEAQRHCKKHFGWKCRIDALEEYPTASTVAQSIKDLRRRHGEDDSSVLFVVSVNSSGRSRRRFELAANAAKGDRSVTVVETSEKAEPDAATLLVLPLESWPPEDDGTCRGCTNPAHVQIHPGSYEQMSTADVTGHAVSPSIAQKCADFFQLASDLDAVHLHHTTAQRTHYAVWIDTPAMLDHAACAQAFIDRAKAVAPETDLVLVPEGPAVDQLIRIAESSFGLPVHVVSSRGLPENVIEGLRTAQHITVVDDTISTGLTLGRIRRSVFNAARELGRNPDMSAVVFAARPSRPQQLLEVQRPFRTATPINVHYVHELALPSGMDCPWCDELDLLRAWLPKLSDASAQTAIRRIERLEGAIVEPLLLGGEIVLSSQRTEGSFFGSLGERSAFAAASAAVVATQSKFRSERTAASVKIIGLEPALDAYFDTILLVGLLRSVDRIRLATIDAQISAKYEKLNGFGAELPDPLRIELAWAVVNDVLPHVGFDPMIADVAGDEAALLRELLELRRGDHI